MKILASSVVQLADRFLHAGYGSASPRPRPLYSFDIDNEIELKLDMASALRLEGEAISALPFDGAPLWAGSPMAQVAMAAAGLFCAVGLYGLARRRSPRLGPLVTRGGPVLVLALALALAGWSKGPAPPKRKPAYKNPGAATRALLHGIIADGILHCPGYLMCNLGQLKPYVSLPVKVLTPGMQHALANFHLDGWGRPFKLNGTRKKGYVVRSAGKDGRMLTRDDLTRRVLFVGHRRWQRRMRTFYLRVVHKKPVVLFRAWRGKLFQYHDRAGAKRLTGTVAYDMMPSSRLEPRKLRRLLRKYTRRKKHDPLVLVVFKDHA